MLAFPVLSYTPHLPGEILWSSEESPTLYGCHKAGSQQAMHGSAVTAQLFSKEHCYVSREWMEGTATCAYICCEQSKVK